MKIVTFLSTQCELYLNSQSNVVCFWDFQPDCCASFCCLVSCWFIVLLQNWLTFSALLMKNVPENLLKSIKMPASGDHLHCCLFKTPVRAPSPSCLILHGHHFNSDHEEFNSWGDLASFTECGLEILQVVWSVSKWWCDSRKRNMVVQNVCSHVLWLWSLHIYSFFSS